MENSREEERKDFESESMKSSLACEAKNREIADVNSKIHVVIFVRIKPFIIAHAFDFHQNQRNNF